MFTKHPKFVHKISDFSALAAKGQDRGYMLHNSPPFPQRKIWREMLLFSPFHRAILSNRIRDFYG